MRLLFFYLYSVSVYQDFMVDVGQTASLSSAN